MPTTTDLESFPDQVSWAGGDLVTVIRDWRAPALPLACSYQAADVALPCSSGRDDQGYQLVPVGQYVWATIPALPNRLWQRQAARLVFTDANGGTVFTLPVAVVPPFYDTCTYTLRSDLPPRWAVGPRSILGEPPARATNLAALSGTVGYGLSLFGGQRQTRLTQAAARGDTTLFVERSEGLPDPGRVSIGRATYRYRAPVPGELRNVQAEVGGDLVQGALADHDEGSPVTDLSGNFSELDSLRRSLFIDTAGGVDLAVIGRLLGVPRSPSLSGDDQYRALIHALGYAPRGAEQTLENVLDIIVGPGKYEIGKDPFANPGQVVVTIPGGEPIQAVSIGRAYLAGEVRAKPTAQGALTCDAPVVGVGSLTLAEGRLVEDLTHALPSAAWSLPAGAASQSPYGALLPSFQAALRYYPPGLDAGGALELGALLRLLPVGTGADRAVVDFIADDGRRRAIVRVSVSQLMLTAAFVDKSGNLLTQTATLGPFTRHATCLLRLTGSGATFTGDAARLTLAASSLPTAGGPGLAIAPVDASKKDWSLALSSLSGGFTSARDYWAARTQATATDARTLTLSPAAADPKDLGKRVMLGGRFYRVAEVVSAASVRLDRGLAHGGAVSRTGAVSYLTCGDTPFQYPDDLGNTVQIVSADSQEAGTFTITALYATPGGKDLSTYQTRLGQEARVAKLDGNPQPAVGLDYRITTRLTVGRTDTLVIGGAGTITTSGTTVTLAPRQALPDNSATYAANVDRVLSAQLVDGTKPDVVRFGKAPPYTFSRYPFYAYDPFDLVETYLPATMPVGMNTQVVYGSG